MSNGDNQQEGLSLRAHMAKVRGRIRREIANAEEEEHEGGELNLVPYLDILVNTIIFLLATTASALALANINVNSPRYEDPAVGAAAAEPQPDDPKLNLTVAVSYKGFIIGGSGAILPGPDGQLPTIKCSVALQKDRCPAYMATRTNAEGEKESIWVDKYDYKGLLKKTSEIKEKYPNERQVILSADRLVPYKVVVKTMDTLRGVATKKCTGKDGCNFDQVILSAGVQ
jgi:biopolymer transport protein ExbD